MNIWENAVITTQGHALLAKLIEGHSLDITRAISGAGYVTPGLLKDQTAVGDPKQELIFSGVSYPENGKCALTCYLNNDEVASGYTAMQVGIYATDPDDGEILFFVAQAASDTGTRVPSAEEMPGYTAEWTFYFQYGQADGVSVTVDPANAVSQQRMEAYVAGEILSATEKDIDAAFAQANA